MTNTATSTATARDFADALNHEYEALHTAKEDAFWTAFMGLLPDAAAARADLDHKDIAVKRFLQDPARLQQVRRVLKEAHGEGTDEDTRTSLDGWRATLEAHVIDDVGARSLAEGIVQAEGELAKARGAMSLGWRDAEGTLQPASSVKLAAMMLSDSDESHRKAAWEGLRSIEDHVLARDFLEILRMRNRLGRRLGGEDYYDWTVKRVERLSKKQIFEWLDELERATRDTARAAVQQLAAQFGKRVEPWNIRYWFSGQSNREQDAYFPFSQSVLRWGRSFAALGVDYQGADLVLDLVDRKGKHDNGFMHGPVPAWREHGSFRPARIQFTANAIPGMVGAGRRAAETLFHEGGHAAHFANIDMPAPCFAQEFAPSSVAFAETQSMFMDSLLGDADWQERYATTRDGQLMPPELIERGLRARQPFAAWELRARLAVCYGEKALYEIPDDVLTPQRALSALRTVERKLLFLEEGSPRPILAVPHLLSSDSSAYYHGYVLAEMAVYQTRDHFLRRDGQLTDNPKIGPELRRTYWQPGNSRGFADLVQSLTGAPLSASHLANDVNRSADQAVADAQAQRERTAKSPRPSGPVNLNAKIRLMHGNELIASNEGKSFEAMAGEFEGWIEGLAKG